MSHTFEQALELAAQCWCDEQTQHITMNEALAIAFAKRLLVVMQQHDELQAHIDEISRAWTIWLSYRSSSPEYKQKYVELSKAIAKAQGGV